MTPRPSKKDGLTGIIKSYQGRLRAFIRKRVPLPEDVDDILQEVLYQFVRANTLMQPVEQVAAWLFRTARNEITDRERKKKELPLPRTYDEEQDEWLDDEISEVLFGTGETPEDEYLKELIRQNVETAIADLPDAQREVFVKTELQGYSFRQLAEETGININTLLSRKHKAVLHLKESLQDLYEDIIGA